MTSAVILGWKRFPRQLRYWALHCSINALPSFIIASTVLGLWEEPASVAAMILAIASFVLIYGVITSLRGPFGDEQSLLSRSLKVGTKVRLVISLVSTPMVCSEALMGYTPDFWAGYAAVVIVMAIGNASGNGAMALKDGETFEVYATTMVEGVIISVTLLMFSFFALVVLQVRQRRKLAKEWSLSNR